MIQAIPEAPADLEEPEIRMPAPPREHDPPRFPLVAVLAPIGIGLTLYAVMGTHTVLLLILFGPLIAIGHVLDRRIGGRRRRRRELAAHAERTAACEAEIAAAHARLVHRARARHPFARDLVAGAVANPDGAVVIGTTAVASGLQVTGGVEGTEELRRRAGRLEEAPLTTRARRIAVSGSRVVVTGATRALIVQLTTGATRLAVVGDEAAPLIGELRAAEVELAEPEAAEAVLVVGAAATEVDARLRVEPSGEASLDEGPGRIRCRVDTLGAQQLRAWAEELVRRQRSERAAAEAIPQRCELGDLGVAPAAGLRARFAVGAGGPIDLDLVREGPHAVIAGTTGSGKSELLISWALALAAARTSCEVNFLCLDFKGGATFDQLARLPHCVGVVTDLDDGEASRVLLGLRAELQRRETVLREHGVRELGERPGLLPRLVVFVDEFQALVEAHTDLYGIMTDVASRGRSLGIHLVLCTQRPSGVYRESLLANASLRLALRLEQPTDSRLLIGSDAAAHLPAEPRGRVLIRTGTADPQLAQVAVARPEEIIELAARERQRREDARLASPRRPWHPPLPRRLVLPDGWAVADEPELQRQSVLVAPGGGAHVAVFGRAASGKTTALRAIVAATAGARRVIVIDPDPEVAWDQLEALGRGLHDALVCIDDLDRLEQCLGEEYRIRLADTLQRFLRTAGPAGGSLVFSAARSTGLAAKLALHATTVLRLSATSRQDWLLQGGEAANVVVDAPPGRGRIGGRLVQVAFAETPLPAPPSVRSWTAFEAPDAGLVVVARRAGALIQAFETAGRPVRPVPTAAARTGEVLVDREGAGPIIVGDLEQWQAAYGVLPRLAERLPVLVIGARPGEWRTLFRGDPLPPFLADDWATGLLRDPDGRCVRIRLRDGVPVEREERVDGRLPGARDRPDPRAGDAGYESGYEAAAKERGMSAPSAT